jgi:hypothetical protein
MTLSLSGRLVQAEIEAEIARQLDAFEAAAGAPPDHVDGHQHVHVLPGVRGPLLAALARRYPGRRILVRDPRDRPGAMARRGSAAKAAFVAALATGLSAAARRAGCVTNRGFSGFSDFGATPYAVEFPRFLQALGPVPMVMCHPGEGRDPDDPIAARRPEELSVLMADPALPGRIWLPARVTPDAPVDWPVHG